MSNLLIKKSVWFLSTDIKASDIGQNWTLKDFVYHSHFLFKIKNKTFILLKHLLGSIFLFLLNISSLLLCEKYNIFIHEIEELPWGDTCILLIKNPQN